MKNNKPKYSNNIPSGLTPPNSLELEKSVLGAMLVDKNSIDEVLSKIKASEIFYQEKHQLIFEAIQNLSNDSVGVDLVTVSNKIKAMGADKKVPAVYVVELSQYVSTAAHVEHHIALLLQFWVRRSTIEFGKTIVGNSYAETVDIFDLLTEAEKGMDHVNEMLDTGKSTLEFGDALQRVVERVEMLTNQEENHLSGVTTGFKCIDKFTGGWQEADLVIVAARPGMGKTSFILKNLIEIALKGDPVGMFSLEMSIEQLAARLVAINSNFHLSQLIKKGFEHAQYFETLNNVVGDMHKLPIYIDDSAGVTIQQLTMKARMWKRKYNIKALFVDYIQLMSGDDKNGNREREISEISRKLKVLAKDLKIPVIALSQLSRAVETRGGLRRPVLSDLRESGSIEQDADTILFIYRPDYYGFELDDPQFEHLQVSGANTEINFAKYRAGSLATKGLWWQGDKTKFMDVEDKTVYYSEAVPVTNDEVF